MTQLYGNLIDPSMGILMGSALVMLANRFGYPIRDDVTRNPPTVIVKESGEVTCSFRYSFFGCPYETLLAHDEVSMDYDGDLKVLGAISWRHNGVRYEVSVVAYAKTPSEDIDLLTEIGVLHASYHGNTSYACGVR